MPTQNEWNQAQQGVSLKSVSPYRGTAITDYYAYNSYWHTATAIDGADGLINYYPQGLTLQQAASLNLYRSGGTSAAGVGQHWTADLMVEADVDLGSEEGSFLLELVDSGRHFQVEFNTKSGEASLWVQTGDKREPLQSGGQAAKAPSPLRGGGNYQVRFSNVDQELRVWVNDKRLNFGEVEYPVVPLEERFPHYSTNDPQDAGPVAVGSQGVSVSVDRLVIYRDKYYTSITSDFSSLPLDYRPGTRLDEVHELFRMPEQWEASPIWGSRRVDLAFELKEDQFLPMGDNSPESMDARCWPAEPFVHRDLLIGKALFIYWPHPWHGFLPHLSRMGMIR